MLLNMNKVEAANALMKETRFWRLETVYGAVAKVLFYLWHGRFPKNFDEIMTSFMDHFVDRYTKEDAVCAIATGEDLVETISYILHNIPEYLKWGTTGNDDFVIIDFDSFDSYIYCELRNELFEIEYFGKEVTLF